MKPNNSMKKIFKKIEKWFDIYIVYFLYKSSKLNRYYDYMRQKYGNEI